MACAAAMALAVFSLPVSGADMALVCVRLGATQLTRTLGASSAERARVRPSTAPLLADMTAWLLKPDCTATEEKRTTEPDPPFLSAGVAALIVSAAEMALSASELV